MMKSEEAAEFVRLQKANNELLAACKAALKHMEHSSSGGNLTHLLRTAIANAASDSA